MQAMTPAGLILSHPLWDGLPPEAAGRLLEACEVRPYGAGEIVFRRGEPGDGLCGVLGGCVALELTASTGAKLVLRLLEPGAFFGEIALLDGQGRCADAVARSASELLFLPRRAFRSALAEHPAVSVRLSEHLCGQIRGTTEAIEDLAFGSLSSRLARRLLAAAERHGCAVEGGIAIDVESPRIEIASALGVSRTIVNRQLSRWRRAGWISVERGRIVLREPDRIASLAWSD
jgi:CRP/FNR family transcriptional regulator, cyclic AMP receptor protein